jgi:hypothetical protein
VDCAFLLVGTLTAPAIASRESTSLQRDEKHASGPQIQVVNIGHGIRLHYVDEGSGVTVIFVHGSLSDGSYRSDQIDPFANHYRVQPKVQLSK